MKYHIVSVAVAFALLLGVGTLHAQTLYDQNGQEVNAYSSATNSLTPGWYYSGAGVPLYYYANGAYYDPSTQSYGGTVLYPSADGPEMNSQALLTPGVPNTGLGGKTFTMLLALLTSASAAVAGTYYLSRSHLI